MEFVIIAHGGLSRDHQEMLLPPLSLPPFAEDKPKVTDEMIEDGQAAHVVMEAELMKCPKTLHHLWKE